MLFRAHPRSFAKKNPPHGLSRIRDCDVDWTLQRFAFTRHSVSHHVGKRHSKREDADDQLANEKRLAAAAHLIEGGSSFLRGSFPTRLLIVHAGAPLR